MHLHAILITELQQLQSLQAQWQALTDSLDGTVDFFASYAYTHAYLSHYAAPDWFVMAIYEQGSGQLQAVFPLQRFHISHGAQRFTACKALGVPYAHYLDFAIRSQCRREVISFFLNEVSRSKLRIEMLFFWPLHEDSKLYLTLLEDMGSHAALKLDRYPNNLYHIDTRGLRFSDYVKTCPSHTFRDAAYCLRRLHRSGAVRWDNPSDPVTLKAAVAQLCERNRARYGAAHAYARFADWPDFITSLVMQLVSQGRAELTTLALDDQTVGACLCFLHKRRRIAYMMDYDDAFRIYSPAKILMHHLIEKSFQENGVFCMGVGNYAYKQHWATSVGEIKIALVFLNPQARAVLEPLLSKPAMGRMCGF